MLECLRRRLTYANLIATLALFVALGGTSYAALKVTGKNVKNSSLSGVDIKNSSLTTADVKDRSLQSKDFKAGQLPAGPKGDKGDTGAAGAAGAAGATNVTTRANTVSAPVGSSDVTASCQAGEKAVGGGPSYTNDEPEITVQQSKPSPASDGSTPTGWTVRYVVTGIPHSVSVLVVCARP